MGGIKTVVRWNNDRGRWWRIKMRGNKTPLIFTKDYKVIGGAGMKVLINMIKILLKLE